MLTSLERIRAEPRPDAALIRGDTDFTLTGALVAAKMQVPDAHIKAGLRSIDRRLPGGRIPRRQPARHW